MINKKRKVVDTHEYDIMFAQGNQIAVAKCGDVIFPAHNDFFITLKDIKFPEENLETVIYIPKHLLLNIKVRELKKDSTPDNLVVLRGSE